METDNFDSKSKNFFFQNPKIESHINLSYYGQEKFSFITQSKELVSFKDEILSYLRERDSYFTEKINSLQFNSDIHSKKIEEISESIENNYNNFLTKQIELTTKLEKFKSYDAFVNKANDKLISHEIRINSVREDLTKNAQKYDEIYLDNLIVPGFIGKGAKYANCKIFFSEIIKEIDKLNTFKEKNIIDLSSYKDRLENIIKTFQFIVDNNNNSQIKYITKLNEKTNKNILDIVDEKLKILRMDNSNFSVELIKKTTELNSLYDKINFIKDNILQEFKNILKEYNLKLEATNKTFDEYKKEQDEINKKFMNFFSMIKIGKFAKNFGFQLGFRQNKEFNKEQPDIKLRNISEINSNIINKRLSKSQNNFKSNNNNIINLNKNKNQLDIQKKIELKKHRNSIDSILNYSKTSSVKSLKNNNNNNNNIIKYNINIKKLKGLKKDSLYIDSSKSHRNNKTSLNLITNLKKQKTKKNNTDLTNIIKLNNKKDDDLSITESALSKMNNSINTYTTTNENNTSLNNINIKNEKFNLFEKDSFDNGGDKIIKEIAPELEQSTAKKNILFSNKKEIEKNFKIICDKIQPINLKLNKQKIFDYIEDSEEKNINYKNFSNKSEQNTTNLSNININNFNINENNNNIIKKNKLKELFENSEKNNLDERMNICYIKLINLESFMKDKFIKINKQINTLKKNYALIISFIKKEKKIKNLNSIKISGYKTINNINNINNSTVFKKINNNIENISSTNNENKNILNLTSNYFNKKPTKIEISSKLSSVSKNMNDEIDISQKIFFNGKFYSNIKDILGNKKYKNFDNKKLLITKNNNSNNKENENINSGLYNINNNYDSNINSNF